MRDARLLIETLRLRPAHDRDPVDASGLSAAWRVADVSALVTLAIREGAALWLRRRLTELGVRLEGDSGIRLSNAAKRIEAQSLRVDAETDNVLTLLASASIPVVPLKAAALRRLSGRIPYTTARAASDVDLLVPEDRADAAWRFLQAEDYRVQSGDVSPHHLPVLVGRTGVAVEIHRTTSSAVTPQEAWRRATMDGETAPWRGYRIPVPSDTELLWHAAVHAIKHVHATPRDGLRLRGWLDVAAILVGGSPIAWERLEARLEAPECVDRDLLVAWLSAANEFLSAPAVPSALTRKARELNVERLLGWRIAVIRKFGIRAEKNGEGEGRWAEKLLEEGTRGEANLAVEPARETASPAARLRHAVAARMARVSWLLRRTV